MSIQRPSTGSPTHSRKSQKNAESPWRRLPSTGSRASPVWTRWSSARATSGNCVTTSPPPPGLSAMPKWSVSTKSARFRCPTRGGTSRSSPASATRPRSTCVDAGLFFLTRRWDRGHRTGMHDHVGNLFAGLDKELVRDDGVNVNHIAPRHFSRDSVFDGSAPDLPGSRAVRADHFAAQYEGRLAALHYQPAGQCLLHFRHAVLFADGAGADAA